MRISPTLLVILLASTLGINGCDKNQLAPIDTNEDVPVISSIRISPDSTYLDALTPVNGQYSIAPIVRVAASGTNGQINVTVDVSRGNGSPAAVGIGLNDDGVLPDSVRGDGVFSGTAPISLTRAQAGIYMIKARAVTAQGVSGNLLTTQLKLTRRNAPPAIFNVVAPDSITRPATGSILFSMTASAADSDGLADISEVFFRSINSSTPAVKFFLYDDGGVIQPNGLTSGDLLAGDGVFSIIVQLPSTATPGERIFAFQARDTFGDSSATLTHSLIVQ